ncbi:MAG: DoxX family protein [Planctomycetes bacterium]|nr:DoxX family protein [Planctomycetota bacterium]MCB9909275.1 DoxX family protein [Planctomycetota bacterium]HPF15362.1 DoxX family protein [Planctomycetota bacterium]
MDKPFYSDSLAKLFLRLSVGGLLLFHGIHKVRHGIDGIEGMLTNAGLSTSLAYGVYLGEVVAPILILLGFMTRPMALFAAFTMLASIYLGFGSDAFGLNEYGGLNVELNLLYFAGAMALFFAGGGRFSVTGGEGRWN